MLDLVGSGGFHRPGERNLIRKSGEINQHHPPDRFEAQTLGVYHLIRVVYERVEIDQSRVNLVLARELNAYQILD